MGYLSYWQLKENPFEELCDTRFFFESDDHREALDRLLYLIRDRNMCMGLLTGEVGSGKTITKNVLINSLPSQNFEVIDFDYCNFCFNDLLFDIVQRITFKDARLSLIEEMEAPSRNDKYQLYQLFKKKLEVLLYEEKRHLVLIFDEAQQIEENVLDELKNLTNNFSRTENFLTIFFVGQPELREKIRRLKQVDQRIFLRFHLNNLDYNGTLRYIQHRLRVAGLEKGTVFTSQGQEMIFRSTAGVPREINRLCKLALNYGFAQNLKEISSEEIQIIIDDLQEHS